MSVKGSSKWTHDAIMSAALKFSTRGEFHKGNAAAYAAARRSQHGLDHFCGHMVRKNEKWTFEKILSIARDYKTQLEFREGNPAAYTAGVRSGRTDELYAHMEPSSFPQDRYIYAITSSDGMFAYIGLSKHPSRRYRQHKRTGREVVRRLIGGQHDFKVLFGPLPEKSARELERSTILDYAAKGITMLNANAGGSLGGSGPRIWTPEDVQSEALKYTNRKDFKRESGGAYKAAHLLGGVAQFCKHMPSQRTIKWTPETIRKEALKYETRRQFEMSCGRAVYVARKLGIMDEICAHMEWRARWPNPSNDNASRRVAA